MKAKGEETQNLVESAKHHKQFTEGEDQVQS